MTAGSQSYGRSDGLEVQRRWQALQAESRRKEVQLIWARSKTGSTSLIRQSGEKFLTQKVCHHDNGAQKLGAPIDVAIGSPDTSSTRL